MGAVTASLEWPYQILDPSVVTRAARTEIPLTLNSRVLFSAAVALRPAD